MKSSHKVYTPEDSYVASCDYIEDAAAVMMRWGAGASVRYDGYTKWRTIYTFPEEIPQNYTLAALYREMRQGEDKVRISNTERYEKGMARRRQEIEETTKNSKTLVWSERTGNSII